MNEQLLDKLFSSELGKRIYDSALKVIDSNKISDMLGDGVLVGFSGGADSVMLLLLLLEYKRRVKAFPMLAVHINHLIRGDEAERDEEFSRNFCALHGVDFIAKRIDVPSLAESRRMGIEEAARYARYNAFKQIVGSREDIRTVAVAHNATDNLETVIFNMMRGSGLSGMCGIAPVRDNVVRPLITIPKEDIVLALRNVGIGFVTDSTNLSCDYSRNYIRHEIIPSLKALNSRPEAMATRLTENLRSDEIFISNYANNFINEHSVEGKISKEELAKLEKSVFVRVLKLMTLPFTEKSPERTHVDKIYDLLSGTAFSFSLPGEVKFVSDGRFAYVARDKNEEEKTKAYSFPLSRGVNAIPNSSEVIIITTREELECYSNIYKISILTQIKYDIINNEALIARTRLDGDSYRFGGMTRKLKKLFNDNAVPEQRRDTIPIICDGEGILWVPGFRVRDGAYDKTGVVIALAELNS